jgi:hypothetical protein
MEFEWINEKIPYWYHPAEIFHCFGIYVHIGNRKTNKFLFIYDFLIFLWEESVCVCIFRLFNPAGGCYFLSSTYSATALPPLYPPNLYANDDIITTGNYLPIPYI